ncbi:MAG: hypothetical protein MUC86_03135 [Burkholderiaceae bacterium]|nr:hypothetical protein [Burkholderiaceae bacterium]
MSAFDGAASKVERGPLPPNRKVRVATTSLAGCFGCHMSFLDIDERLFELVERIEFDRSPFTDIKTCGDCDIGFIEGGLCNAENVEVYETEVSLAKGGIPNDPELPLPLDKVHPLHRRPMRSGSSSTT